jgi:hypothetical protein
VRERVPRKQKTPQEKKRDSYLKDRRMTYGENAKASRTLIPKRKASGSHTLRRIANQALAEAAALADPEIVDALISRLKRTRRQGWKKVPDQPLQSVIARRRKRRAVATQGHR